VRARLTSSHFVGRVGELAELRLAAREAAAGRPALVLLGGDSGVGKTRLVAELEHELGREEGETLVLRGEGVEQADGELPYAPLLGALRPLVREHHPALEALSSGSRAQLATILPGLDDSRQREDRSDPNGQVRLFEAVLELLALISEHAPVVLILEDMHWADRSTRAFTTFLARSLRSERVLLLLSYRSDELHRRHALRPLLSELDRLERARRIDLEPLDRDELAEILTDILGGEPQTALLERLFARSEGNPLYTEELLAVGLDGRAAAPQSLRDAFLVRIERLSPDAQRAARVVAVGRSLREPAIAAVSGLETAALQAALRDALAERILVADDEGRFGFRHALLREALTDDLLPGERSELHLALARHLEAQLGSASDDELALTAAIAGHYASAGDQPAALRSTIAAAQAAAHGFAYGEAAELTERALELWPRVSDAERLLGLDHVELLRRAAENHFLATDRSRAEVLLQSALSELDPDSDPARFAAVLARLSRAAWSLNRGAEAVAIGERALGLIPADDPLGTRPLLRAWLARMRFLRGRFREAAADAEVALQAAVEADDCAAQSELLNTLGMAQIALGRVEEGIGRLRRAIELGRAADDWDTVVTAYSNLADLLNVAGRTTEGFAVAREGLAIAPRHLARSFDWMALTVSELALEAGDSETAREYLWPDRSRLVGPGLIFRLTREADLALAEGDDDRAEEALSQAEGLVAVSAEAQWVGMYGALLGELRRRRGDLDGARQAVDDALDRLELCTDDVMRIARVTAVGLRAEVDRAQRARDLHDRAALRDALARARIHFSRHEAAAQDGGPVERAYLATAKAEMTRAQGKPGVAAWARAAAAWEGVQRPYPAAVARWREAEAHVLADDRRAAATAAAAALELAVGLRSDWLAREVRTLAERARLGLIAAPDSTAAGERGANGETVAQDPFGLTPRERQVLTLLAEGATNRQIGEALYMAEKTASVHVSRILAKLGVQGRTQAAAVAHRQHLA